MTKTLDEAINKLTTEIVALEATLRKKKESVNLLCGIAERPAAYALDSNESAMPTSIRSDQFYMQPLASAVRTILEMRQQQNLGAASNNEIYDALMAGGYQFNTKSDDVARNSLRNSLAKNTVTFHKLPNGRFGLLNWYPKAQKSAAGAEVEEIEEEEAESETQQAETEATKTAAAS